MRCRDLAEGFDSLPRLPTWSWRRPRTTCSPRPSAACGSSVAASHWFSLSSSTTGSPDPPSEGHLAAGGSLRRVKAPFSRDRPQGAPPGRPPRRGRPGGPLLVEPPAGAVVVRPQARPPRTPVPSLVPMTTVPGPSRSSHQRCNCVVRGWGSELGRSRASSSPVSMCCRCGLRRWSGLRSERVTDLAGWGSWRPGTARRLACRRRARGFGLGSGIGSRSFGW